MSGHVTGPLDAVQALAVLRGREPAARPIKRSTIEAIERYHNRGILPGGFLQAVLSNDLKEACQQGDQDNLDALVAIVALIYNELPACCWGSPEKVAAWVSDHPRRASKETGTP